MASNYYVIIDNDWKMITVCSEAIRHACIMDFSPNQDGVTGFYTAVEAVEAAEDMSAERKAVPGCHVTDWDISFRLGEEKWAFGAKQMMAAAKRLDKKDGR